MQCPNCGVKKFIVTFSKQSLIDESLNEIDGIEAYIGGEAGVDFISCAKCEEEIQNMDATSRWILSRLRKAR
ncbi:hypothetical protein FJZ31_30525 [Candidatus Poribacteria bacterium]|nr:hypothetical protein [Candidatus Poribacteria bacterium]